MAKIIGYSKTPFSTGLVAVYHQRPAISLSDHPKWALKSAYVVREYTCFSPFTFPTQPPASRDPVVVHGTAS